MEHTPPLSGRDRRALKAAGFSLPVTVIVGQNTSQETAVRALDRQFAQAELVKVRFAETDRVQRKQAVEDLAVAAKATVLGLTGRVALLHRKKTDA